MEEVKKEERRRVGVVGGGRKEAAVRGSSRDGEVGGDGRKEREKRKGTEPSEPRSEVSVQWTDSLSLSFSPRLRRGYVGCRATR